MSLKSTLEETLVTQLAQPIKTPVTKEGASKTDSSKLAVDTGNKRDDINVSLVNNTGKTLTVARPIRLDLLIEPGGSPTQT